MLERTPKDGELVMAGIAVDWAHRGCGIGSPLLREVGAVAADAGCHRIRLVRTASPPSRFGPRAP
ncbi:GNAT family N-acetyltransferase [Streptomyces sp. NPDC055254]